MRTILLLILSFFVFGCATQAQRMASYQDECSIFPDGLNYNQCIAQKMQNYEAEKARRGNILQGWANSLKNPYGNPGQPCYPTVLKKCY